MFIPEYTITPKVLKSISTLEYGKAIIDSTTILPSWEDQIKKDTIVRIVSGSLTLLGVSCDQKSIKTFVDNISPAPSNYSIKILEAINFTDSLAARSEVEEEDFKEINKTLTGNGVYRSTKVLGKVPPEEVLAETVQLFDWLNSIDAKDTHPVITSAIVKAALEIIEPFENLNELTSNLATYLILKSSGYRFRDFISIESYYNNTKRSYKQLIDRIDINDPDYTEWIDYFSEGLASEVSTVSQNIKLLAKDTKIAKATGRARITKRQERIVGYLQDYGILQNKDFSNLFPEKSEDTILRDLKVLIDMGIVQKIGSTKSSRYELK